MGNEKNNGYRVDRLIDVGDTGDDVNRNHVNHLDETLKLSMIRPYEKNLKSVARINIGSAKS